MLRSLKSLGGSRADQSTAVGVCLHRAMAVAAVPPSGRGSGEARIVELPTEADEQARTLARAVSDLGVKGCRASVTLPIGAYHLMQIGGVTVNARYGFPNTNSNANVQNLFEGLSSRVVVAGNGTTRTLWIDGKANCGVSYTQVAAVGGRPTITRDVTGCP